MTKTMIPITGSEKKTLPAAAKEGILYPVRKDGQDQAELTIRLVDSLAAPVSPGTDVGKALLTVNGEPVKSVPLFVQEGAQPLTFRWFFKRVMEAYLAS